MNEIVREFLLETQENLAQLDLDLVKLEKEPTERETLARVFRTLHTVKGTAGFLGLMKLQSVAHAAENLLSKLRAGELTFNPAIASALLAAVDAVRRMLDCVEKTEKDGDDDFGGTIRVLEQLLKPGADAAPVALVAPKPPVSAAASLPPVPVPIPEPAKAAPAAAAVPKTIVAPPPAEDRTLVGTLSPPSLNESEPRTSAVSDSAIRVDVRLLDKLMTLVGELVLARNQIMQFSASQEDAPFLNTVQRLNVLTTELQTGVMKTRMQPIGNVWTKFPRLVRDLAVACGKQVRLDLEGRETELDKTIVEAIRDPLTHLVRNAVDHGLETPTERTARNKPAEGRLTLHAFHEGGKVIIEISDDGRGIDPKKVREKAVSAKLLSSEQAAQMGERDLINLIFLPGFSTTDKVTQFSGRGVGMDVVRTNIERIGGSVDVESQLGRGVTIRMKIPLTLAIIPALTVTCGGDRYAIPQVSLLELVRLESDQGRAAIEWVQGTPVYRLRGHLLPLVRLDEQLGVASDRRGEDTHIVVLQADDRQFGLVVDAIHDTEEIVVKPLQKQLKGINAFAGATIMGDGKVALILDVLGLAQLSRVVSGVRDRVSADKQSAAEKAADRRTVLLCATDEGGRVGIPLSDVARLEEFPRSAVERAGTRDVVQYRDQILPLVHVGRQLRRAAQPSRSRRKDAMPRRKLPANQGEVVQVVVYATDRGHVGLVVGRIIDIVDETILVRSRASRPGVLCTAVIQEKITELLDVEQIVRSADPELFAATAETASTAATAAESA